MNPILLKPTGRADQPGRRHRPPVADLDAAGYHARQARPARRRPRRPRRPAEPVRRGDLRGRRQPGGDQPARPRHRQPPGGPRGRLPGHRGRRHRPGRRVRRPVRHRRPAARRAPPTGAGLRDQQVPGRPDAARRPVRPSSSGRTWRADARRAAVADGRRPRRRGLPGPRAPAGPAAASRPPARAARSTWPWSAFRASPTSPTSTLSASSPGVTCPPGGAPRWPWAIPTCVVLPGTKATVADLAWLRGSGVWSPPSRPQRRGPRARHLRRLPDARPHASPTRWRPASPGSSPGIGWLPVDTVFDADKVTRQRRGTAPRPPGVGLRDPPRTDHRGGAVAGPRRRRTATEPEGAESGDGGSGTSLHGLFEEDGFRAAFLAGGGRPAREVASSPRACRSRPSGSGRSTGWRTCSKPASTWAASRRCSGEVSGGRAPCPARPCPPRRGPTRRPGRWPSPARAGWPRRSPTPPPAGRPGRRWRPPAG